MWTTGVLLVLTHCQMVSSNCHGFLAWSGGQCLAGCLAAAGCSTLATKAWLGVLDTSGEVISSGNKEFFFCKIVKQQLKLSIKQWFFVMENGFISVLWTVLWTNCETTLNTVLMDSNHVETAVISKLSISIISHGTNWETWDMESLRLYGLFLPMVKWLTSESGWSIYGDITWYDWYIMIGGW